MAKQIIVADDEKKEVKRRPVGADGTFLKADSGDASGVSWATPSAGITGETIRKNSGANVGTRPRLNLIEGSNITLTVADDGVDNEVDITIAATASTSGHTIKDEGTPLTQRAGLNFVGDSVVATDDAGNNETDVTVNHLASAVHSAAQPVTVRKNTGANVGTRPRINLIEGSNVTLTVVDDGVDNEIDVTIASSGGGGSPVFKIVTDTSDRTMSSGTTFTAFPGISTISMTLAIGEVVELLCHCFMIQSGSAGATTGTGGFIVDQPTSADINMERAKLVSSIQDTQIVSGFFQATEAGAHIFKIAAKSGNAANVVLLGTQITTQFSATNKGTPS